MYTLSINIWFQKLMKQFFFGIDNVVFNMISSIYDLLISIARTSVFTQADIIEMADKIYKLLAVFMIFKVTFSLITYVVNPDDFSDKNKGISKLSVNIIISLGLLILTPYIFNMAYKLQTIILEDNTLATLIFETEETGDESAGDFINTAGDEIAFYTMSPFFTPNTSITKLSACVDLTLSDGRFNPACLGINYNYNKIDPGEKAETIYNVDVINTMYALKDDDNSQGISRADIQNYGVGINEKNLGMFFRQKLAVSTYDPEDGDEVFIMEYKYIFSTVVGVLVILLLLSFCMDVALRSIKLGFLQLIAPIPILSYVDPKSGKDGMFKKWYQLCFKTFLSLFIRLLALYFAIYIIGKVADMQLVDIVDGSYVTNRLIGIFIIIGALMFAKDFPKILEGLGIKLDGDGKFSLNPLKKLDDGAIGFKKARQTAGRLGMAGLAGAAAFGTNALATKGNLFKRLGSGIAGSTSATARGLGNTLKGKKAREVFTNSYSGANRARTSRADRKSDGVGWMEMQESKLRQAVGMHTKGENVKSATDTAKQISSVYTSMMSAAEGNDKASFVTNINGQNRTFNGIKGLNQFIDEVKKTQINRNDYTDESDYLQAVQEQQNLLTALDDAKKDRLNKISSGIATTNDAATDSAIRSGYSQMQKLAKELSTVTDAVDPSIAKIPDGVDAKTINGMAKGISNQIIASEGASHATTVDEYAAKKKQS